MINTFPRTKKKTKKKKKKKKKKKNQQKKKKKKGMKSSLDKIRTLVKERKKFIYL